MGDKSSETVLQKQTTEPWSGIQPMAKEGATEAQRLYRAGQLGGSYYPGATYIPPTTQEMTGLQGQQNLATQGNQMLPGLLNSANRSLNMQSGRGNEDLTGLLDIAAGKAKSAMESSFGGMGRSDPSGAANGMIGREVGDIYTKGFANQYNQDEANKLAWAGMAPDIRAQQFGDAEKMIGVGAGYRGELQAENQSNIDRYTAQGNRSLDQLTNYNNIIGGLGGGSGTQTTYGQQGSPIYGLLGGAATGAGVGSAFGPWGAGIGGGLGGLAGLFGGN